jgi:hypothetical protein
MAAARHAKSLQTDCSTALVIAQALAAVADEAPPYVRNDFQE